MRLGLLGLGRIGAFHAETLAGLPTVEELVINDPVPALAEQIAALGTNDIQSNQGDGRRQSPPRRSQRCRVTA